MLGLGFRIDGLGSRDKGLRLGFMVKNLEKIYRGLGKKLRGGVVNGAVRDRSACAAACATGYSGQERW